MVCFMCQVARREAGKGEDSCGSRPLPVSAADLLPQPVRAADSERSRWWRLWEGCAAARSLLLERGRDTAQPEAPADSQARPHALRLGG